MTIEVHVDSMTVTEKLQTMEVLWDSLRTESDALPVPDWHKKILDERTRQLESGEAVLSDWPDAKERLQNLGQ